MRAFCPRAEARCAAEDWGVLLPHLINGPVALVLLLTRRADRRTHLPLGPALLAGAWLAALATARLSPT